MNEIQNYYNNNFYKLVQKDTKMARYKILGSSLLFAVSLIILFGGNFALAQFGHNLSKSYIMPCVLSISIGGVTSLVGSVILAVTILGNPNCKNPFLSLSHPSPALSEIRETRFENETYEEKYVQILWANYEIYNTQSQQWEHLKVLNEQSPILLDEIGEIETIGGYLNIYVLDEHWFTAEEVLQQKAITSGSCSWSPWVRVYLNPLTMSPVSAESKKIIDGMMYPPLVRRRAQD